MSEEIKKEEVTYEDMIKNLPPETELVEVPKRKRGRPPKPDSEKKGARGDYFRPVEDNIMLYLQTEDKFEKDKIFNQYLYQPIYDMISTIYRRYFVGKYNFDETPDEIINDTYSSLVTKFSKFDVSKNKKAYSYYQTIVKNHIKLKTLEYQKRLKRSSSYEEMSHVLDNSTDYMYSIEDNSFISQLIKNVIDSIRDVLEQPEANRINKNDAKVGRGLIDILLNWEEYFSHMGSNKFDKNVILLHLQESTLLNRKEIKDSMKKFKGVYFMTKKDML